jgi:ribosomal protein S18 acetylase RimI-like enzyme
MDFILFDDLAKNLYKEELLNMIVESDKDFVPPLSSRTSTTQSCFDQNAQDCSVLPYFEKVLTQNIIGVFDGKDLVGFLSFIQNYTLNEIDQTTFDNIYLSTLILKPITRGQGLTYKLYDHVFNVLYPNHNVFTRTWSTNFAHLKILDKFGFTCFKTIKDDRAKGIDTVYFSLLRKGK